jgi:hypothetical protein
MRGALRCAVCGVCVPCPSNARPVGVRVTRWMSGRRTVVSVAFARCKYVMLLFSGVLCYAAGTGIATKASSPHGARASCEREKTTSHWGQVRNESCAAANPRCEFPFRERPERVTQLFASLQTRLRGPLASKRPPQRSAAFEAAAQTAASAYAEEPGASWTLRCNLRPTWWAAIRCACKTPGRFLCAGPVCVAR